MLRIGSRRQRPLMRLLALETSTEYCSCALRVDGVVRASHVLAGQSHSDLLLPAVARLMAEAGLGFSQLDVIAFGAGPGSFTGLRIACGAAQGLAFAHDLPVVGVSSLETLAEASGAPRVIAALDARMGELYLAAFERAVPGGGAEVSTQAAETRATDTRTVGTRTADAEWQTVLAPLLARPDALPALFAQTQTAGWFGTGSGFAVYGAALLARYAPMQIDAAAVPHAAAVAAIAERRAARGETVAAEHAVPLYVRDKVALDVREQAALRAANAQRAAGAPRGREHAATAKAGA